MDNKALFDIRDFGARQGAMNTASIQAAVDEAAKRGGKVLAVIEPGLPDGFRCDTDGNIWTSAGDGVHVLTPSGVMIGKINTPRTPANLCFGGPKNNWLFIAATDSLHLLHTMANGARRP